MKNKPTIGLTLGDPAGIGPEIVIKALSDRVAYEVCRPVVFGDRCILERSLKDLNASLDLNEVSDPSGGRFQIGTIDFIDTGALSEPVAYGEVSADGGRAGLAYLDRATDAAPNVERLHALLEPSAVGDVVLVHLLRRLVRLGLHRRAEMEALSPSPLVDVRDKVVEGVDERGGFRLVARLDCSIGLYYIMSVGVSGFYFDDGCRCGLTLMMMFVCRTALL